MHEKYQTNHLYQPLGLNFWTCWTFIASAYWAYSRNCNSLFLACSTCLILGLLYHATYHYVFRQLDIFMNCIFFIYFTIQCATWNMYYYLSIISVVIVGAGYPLFSFSKYGLYFHSFIHIAGNTGIILMTEGCYISNCSLCSG